jgi:hypothetical protein
VVPRRTWQPDGNIRGLRRRFLVPGPPLGWSTCSGSLNEFPIGSRQYASLDIAFDVFTGMGLSSPVMAGERASGRPRWE